MDFLRVALSTNLRKSDRWRSAKPQVHGRTTPIMKPFHIAIVGPLPPPSGGMANQTRQLAELLSAEGIKVSVIQVNAPYRPAWIEKIPVVRACFRLIPYLSRL